jgi:hypothetical protein
MVFDLPPANTLDRRATLVEHQKKSPTISLKLGEKEESFTRGTAERVGVCPSSTLEYDSDSGLHSLSARGGERVNESTTGRTPRAAAWGHMQRMPNMVSPKRGEVERTSGATCEGRGRSTSGTLLGKC